MKQEKSYWLKKDYDARYSCPNVSLFRLLGQTIGSVEGLSVVDFGFGGNHAADLWEMRRRGAALCVGVDINPKFVDDFNEEAAELGCQQMFAMCADIGNMDFESIQNKFDIAYSRDTIYYLSDDEIARFFAGVSAIIKPGGALCVQFIERDITTRNNEGDISFDGIDFEGCLASPIHQADNPIRYLSPNDVLRQAVNCGFGLAAHKTHIQSYGKENSHFRIDKYLLLTLSM